MESVSLTDNCGSSYAPLPLVPDTLVSRNFLLSDGNVEITSMDIAPHGAFVVVGTSSGMVLLFDMSNPDGQKDGLLIGQIRARGMHTNLILTVKFSEDGRFVFAGVSKGSSEMLAIDLGKVLVEWRSAGQAENGNGSNREAGETLQQLQLQNTVTFSFSDAKLRGFGAVVRMDHPRSSEGQPKASSASFSDSSALYRLACGRGIKNVHIWHFTVGYLTSAKAGEQDLAGGDAAGQRMMHGKWEYVCDVASNGNTITHIEFRQAGNELMSKSAGMSIRVWDLRGNETLNGNSAALPAAGESEGGEGSTTPAASTVAPSTTASSSTWLTIKPTYADISNSQDVKCLLPVGTGAYGGTYQFAVLNTAAPKEANRDVLELPERFSGDAAAAASGGLPSNASSNNLLRGRRITREIEQVISTDEGSHAILLCADGGVVYYSAHSYQNCPQPAEGSDGDEARTELVRSSASALLELPDLFRQKDVQQHTGSWALRRVGRQGLVVLLRAYPEANSNAVVVETRLLSEHLPQEARRRLTDGEDPTAQLLYYQDSTTHGVQRAARRAWKVQSASSVKRSASSATITGGSTVKVAKKAKVSVESEVETVTKKKTVTVVSGEKSPRSSSFVTPAPLERKTSGGALVTPATASQTAGRLNKPSPSDATERLISSAGARSAEDGALGGTAVSPVSGPIPVPAFRSSRISSRQSSTSSFAKLRALRDDDSSADEGADEAASLLLQLQPKIVSAPSVQFSHKDLCIGPAPKVRRLAIQPLPAALSAAAAARSSDTPTTALPEGVATPPTTASWKSSGSFFAPVPNCRDEAVLGLGSGRTLGSAGLQRMGVILMEQDRLKAQFVRDVACASVANTGNCDDDAVALVVNRYRATSEELVRRQQLELQGACAIDSICSSHSHSCWGDDLKVVFRHEDIYSQALTWSNSRSYN